MNRDLIQNLLFLVLSIILGRITKDFYILFLGLAGMFYAWQNRNGLALRIFLILPFLTQINPLIYPHSGIYAVFSRMAMMMITFGFMMGAAGRARGHEKLPIMSLMIYMVFACMSSFGGYEPVVSFLKIINFVIFIMGMYFGVMNIHHRVDELRTVRSMMLAIAVFMIFGSFCSLAVPGICYLSSIRIAWQTGDIGYAGQVITQEEGNKLFCGLTNQSQFLAPYLACLAGWVMCDMIFITKKVDKLHLGLLALVPFMEYLTRSRVGLFSFMIMGAMSVFYALPHLRSRSAKLRRTLKGAVFAGVVLVLLAGAVAEARNNSITKWLRKVDNVEEDIQERSLGDALTASRQRLIEASMADFRESPLLGKGFQVAWYSPYGLDPSDIKSYFTSPVEKGLVFAMILGEGGILGFIAFMVFLMLFYYGCSRQKYYATATLFTVYLSTNVAEATFFSPSGGGGTMWITYVVGGFIIDIINKYGKVSSVLVPIMIMPAEPIPQRFAMPGQNLNSHRASYRTRRVSKQVTP